MGVALVALTGWLPLDSIVAIAVGLNILWTGAGLIRHAANGLMDHAMNPADEAQIAGVLKEFIDESAPGELEFHGLQTRESGRERFVSLHVLVPGAWPVARGHDLLQRIEDRIGSVLTGARVLTHLEPIEDPRAYDEMGDGHTGLDTRGGWVV